jgi:hypothetical protein
MSFKEKLVKFLENFSSESNDFRDIDVDGILYRVSTESIEIGTEVSIIKFDEEGNEITTPVEDNTWTIEDITFRTENGVVVEIMDGEVDPNEGGSEETTIDEVLFEKIIDTLENNKKEIEKLKEDFNKIFEDFSKSQEDLKKIKNDFNIKPANVGIPKLSKSKEAVVDYREIAKKYKNNK